MNPVAALLALLALAGPVVARRRPVGWAWLVVGLAATALLAPALAIPDGMPSPAAIAGAHPPWQGELEASAGNAALSDVTWQIQPWLHFARHELRAGRLPVWNPFQYAGVPFWGNGQSAPLFPLHLLFAALPEALGWLLLPWLKVMTGGLGAWWLGRQLGLSPPAALLAAVAFPLAGMPVAFLLYPLGSAVALAPWVLGATERLAAGRGGVPCLALLAGLQLLAGHPETSLHTALLSALYLLVRGVDPGLGAGRAWGRLAGGWLAAAALAAVHLLPFVANMVESSRWQADTEGAGPPGRLLLTLPLRLALPALYGNPVRGTWWGPWVDNSTAVYVGAATLVLAVSGLTAVGWRRRLGATPAAGGRRWAAVAALLFFSLAAAYQLSGLRQLLDSLPIVGRTLQHRLLFAVCLTMALLAGLAVDRWGAGARRGTLAGAAVAGAMLAFAWATFADDWAARGLLAGQVAQSLWLGAVALALVAAARRASGPTPRWLAWALPVVVAVDLLAAHVGLNPGLSRRDFFPRTAAVRFLAGAGEGRVAATGAVLRPNAATVYRLADVRGDDTVRPALIEDHAAAALGAAHPTYFVPVGRWDPAVLDSLAVRWLMTGPEEPSPEPAARLVYRGPDARVWERQAAPGPLSWSPADAGCRASEEPRLPAQRRIDWTCDQPATLIVSETWDAGWRGRLDGRPVAVARAAGRFLAVPLPAGAGRLELRHRPVGLAGGAVVSLVTALGLVAGIAVARRRRGPGPAGSAASDAR